MYYEFFMQILLQIMTIRMLAISTFTDDKIKLVTRRSRVV